MAQLLPYLNSLNVHERVAFAQRCDTTVGYLRKAVSIGQKLSEGLCLRLVAQSGGVLTLEELRADVDWDFLRAALIGAVHPWPPAASVLKATSAVPLRLVNVDHAFVEIDLGPLPPCGANDAPHAPAPAPEAA